MLDVPEKDLMAPAAASAPASPAPDAKEEEEVTQISEESCASEPEEVCPFRGRIRPHMGQTSSNTTGIRPLTGELNPCGFDKTLGVQLDLLSLESLQVTISHG